MLRMLPRHAAELEVKGMSRRRRRTQLIVVKQFQIRYALFFAFFGLVGAALVGGVTLYLLNYNYDLFVRTELISNPRLVDNLYREIRLANAILILSIVGFIVFMALFGVKFSHRIAVPIYLIQEKMRGICRGNLKDANIRLRQTDEFLEFGETYNYLVSTLKTQVKQDIDCLQKLKPDKQNRDATRAWECALEEKNAQLSGTDASTGPNPSSRHAS